VNENQLRYEGWRVAAASSVGIFLAAIVVYTFAVLLKPLTLEFSWSREAVSSAYGILAIMSAACAAPLGYLFDRLGPRRIVVPCVAVFGCAFASLSLLTSLWQLYAIFAILGVAATGMSPVAFARAISSWFDRRRGLALAVAISGGATGGLVHPPAAEALIRAAGWRTACQLFGGLVLIVGLPVAIRFIRERPATVSHLLASERAEGTSVGEAFASRPFWILVGVLFSSSIAQNSAIVHMVALLTDRGVPANRAAVALSAMGAASIVGRILTGFLVDRFFAARVSFVLLTIAALGTYALSGAHTFAAGTLAAVLIGLGMGGESDVIPYLLSRYFGLRSFSTLYGFTWIPTAAAGAAGPVLMGRAFDLTGSYEAVLVRLAAAMFACGALMLAMPRYRPLSFAAAASPSSTT
jgi:MFS family permease